MSFNDKKKQPTGTYRIIHNAYSLSIYELFQSKLKALNLHQLGIIFPFISSGN